MDPDFTEMANEIKSKVILHWNCRGLNEFPEVIRQYGSHIQEIYLKWNKLTTLPPWIAELSITNLYLYGNMIKDLPVELGKMRHLIVLDLSINKLEHVPSCISNLNTLKCLYLNYNFIKSLPVELSQLKNLETLSVMDNRITVLPEWTGSLPKLKELYANNNLLRELPNRLTLAPMLNILSVSRNRLRYLPLNGFSSSCCVDFSSNEYLNYVPYPLLLQSLLRLPTTNTDYFSISLTSGCSKTYYDTDALNTNIKLNIETRGLNKMDANVIIELPGQLLKIHDVYENEVCSLWELALRKIYTMRYMHTLDISTSPPYVTVLYKPLTINSKSDFTWSSRDYYLYNLFANGPVSICVNFRCQQPIFTQAWIIAGFNPHAKSIITIALCCSKSCATTFLTHSNMIVQLYWHSID